MELLNYQIISSNINEALEELEDLKKEIEGKELNEVEFRLSLQHIYHHLNFAWNARKETVEKYENLSDEDFKRWGKYPKDIDFED